jgi:prephenate dehydrogenase
MSSRPTSPERPFATVAILGLGAMGGSLARALNRLEPAPMVLGWSPVEGERAEAVEAGAVGSAPADWHAAVEAAELVVIAAPLRASCELVGRLAEATSAGTTITDVASLKAPLAAAAADAEAQDRWVGSHPMTGSEESGFAASRAELYEGARVWTVAHEAAEARVAPVHAFWTTLGARPKAIEAEEHDRLMAMASHLPQLVANALASVLERHDVPHDRLGPGGTDMTRLAASSPEMWREIFEHASPELVAGLRALADGAGEIASLLESGDLGGIERLMTATRAWSRTR